MKASGKRIPFVVLKMFVKRTFGGEYEVCKDYSSTVATVPLPSQGKVRDAPDYFICNSEIFMISDAKKHQISCVRAVFQQNRGYDLPSLREGRGTARGG